MNWLPVTSPTMNGLIPSVWWTCSGSTGNARPTTRKPMKTAAMIARSGFTLFWAAGSTA